jgi:hypothetical protein
MLRSSLSILCYQLDADTEFVFYQDRGPTIRIMGPGTNPAASWFQLKFSNLSLQQMSPLWAVDLRRDKLNL